MTFHPHLHQGRYFTPQSKNYNDRIEKGSWQSLSRPAVAEITYSGIPDETERANLIAYLRTPIWLRKLLASASGKMVAHFR
jgi:hypothetical protein